MSDTTSTSTGTTDADPGAADPITAVLDTTTTTTIDPVVGTPSATPVAPVVPETYTLKAADGQTIDPALIEKTAATARTLGLSNDQAQAMLDYAAAEITTSAKTAAETAAKTAAEDAIASLRPGGAEYSRVVQEWNAAVLANYGGSTEKRDVAVEQSLKVLGTFDDGSLTKFLHETGYGSHPVVVGFLTRLYAAYPEATFVSPGSAASGSTTVGASRLFDKSLKQDAG